MNIAARLQGVASPGDILVSDSVYTHVRRASPCTFQEPEEMALKGILEPLTVYRIKAKMDRHVYQTEATRPAPKVS